MAFPTIFATLAGGNEPLSLFDTMFNVVGTMGTVFTTAAGANTIALTPTTNMPTITAYTNYRAFGFVAAANSSGAVTANVSGVGALPVYLGDGVTQATSGSIVSGAYYLIAYNSALNSGGGGFQLIGAAAGGGGGGGVNPGTANQLGYYASTGSTISGDPNATIVNGGLTLGQAGTAGQVVLNGATSGTATIKVAAAAGSVNFQLPATNGTSGQQLQTDGAGNTSWAGPASGGGLTHITTVNASAAANVIFDSTKITSTYNKYVLEFDGVFSSAAGPIVMSIASDNGSTPTAPTCTGSSPGTYASPNLTANIIGTSGAVGGSGKLTFTIGGASAQQILFFNFSNGSSSSIVNYGQGNAGLAAAMNWLQLSVSGQTISGNFRLYGLTN